MPQKPGPKIATLRNLTPVHLVYLVDKIMPDGNLDQINTIHSTEYNSICVHI